ncbi:MAG: hypothetical protein M3O82_03525 [Verrucomicrobiota bacterium]|nr:hypothetical protein [Verrucomicrobiota bacterium]
MKTTLLFSLAVVILLPACSSMQKSKEAQKKIERAQEDARRTQDVSFQGFLGRLRKAVAKRDTQMLSTMITPNFGYRLEPLGEGPGAFQYWTENGIWPELEMVLREPFLPNGNYMVAPSQFVSDPEYRGYRAGMALVNGSWRFAYFVTN